MLKHRKVLHGRRTLHGKIMTAESCYSSLIHRSRIGSSDMNVFAAPAQGMRPSIGPGFSREICSGGSVVHAKIIIPANRQKLTWTRA